jgi:predicted nucleic acid-binding protein
VLVDTMVFSWLHERRQRYVEFGALIRGHGLAVSFATVGELRAGYLIAGVGARRTTALNAALGRFVVLMPNSAVVEQWATIYSRFRDRLKGDGVNDMWTAACALSYAMPVVTDDLTDFGLMAGEFPGLRLVHPDL